MRGTAYNDTWAVYVQATAEITANARMTAGIRFNEDLRQLVSRNAFIENGNVDCALTRKFSTSREFAGRPCPD